MPSDSRHQFNILNRLRADGAGHKPTGTNWDRRLGLTRVWQDRWTGAFLPLNSSVSFLLFFSISPSCLAASSVLLVASLACWFILYLLQKIFLLATVLFHFWFKISFTFQLPPHHHLCQGAECRRGLILRPVPIITCGSFTSFAFISSLWIDVAARSDSPLSVFVSTHHSLSLSHFSCASNLHYWVLFLSMQELLSMLPS